MLVEYLYYLLIVILDPYRFYEKIGLLGCEHKRLWVELAYVIFGEKVGDLS